MALAQPLKWHGGKYYLAKRIISLMAPHLHYVEPYFGGGAVLLARDPNRDWYRGADDCQDRAPSYFKGCSEVVNDVNLELTNFWRVLQDEPSFRELQRRCQKTPFSQVEFLDAKAHALARRMFRMWKRRTRSLCVFGNPGKGWEGTSPPCRATGRGAR